MVRRLTHHKFLPQPPHPRLSCCTAVAIRSRPFGHISLPNRNCAGAWLIGAAFTGCGLSNAYKGVMLSHGTTGEQGRIRTGCRPLCSRPHIRMCFLLISATINLSHCEPVRTLVWQSRGIYGGHIPTQLGIFLLSTILTSPVILCLMIMEPGRSCSGS